MAYRKNKSKSHLEVYTQLKMDTENDPVKRKIFDTYHEYCTRSWILGSGKRHRTIDEMEKAIIEADNGRNQFKK